MIVYCYLNAAHLNFPSLKIIIAYFFSYSLVSFMDNDNISIFLFLLLILLQDVDEKQCMILPVHFETLGRMITNPVTCLESIK
jgi:hypothetical protein